MLFFASSKNWHISIFASSVCKFFLVNSIVDSINHAILLLYRLHFGSDTMPTNNSIESIYSRTMYFFDTVSKVCIFLLQAMQKKSSNNKKLLCHWPTQNHLTIKNCYVISQGNNFKIICQMKQPDLCQYGLFINNFVWYRPFNTKKNVILTLFSMGYF